MARIGSQTGEQGRSGKADLPEQCLWNALPRLNNNWVGLVEQLKLLYSNTLERKGFVLRRPFSH